MTNLTLEALCENPRNILGGTLTADASELLLEVAYQAAAYCVVAEYGLMEAARAGNYTPSWWKRGESPDAHEEAESRWLAALEKFIELHLLRIGVDLRNQS